MLNHIHSVCYLEIIFNRNDAVALLTESIYESDIIIKKKVPDKFSKIIMRKSILHFVSGFSTQKLLYIISVRKKHAMFPYLLFSDLILNYALDSRANKDKPPELRENIALA